MPGHEFLELLGASSLIIIILSVFWKGDDAVSPEFRTDISGWLLRLKPPKADSPIGAAVLGLFVKVFGPRHWTIRCFVASCIVSWLTFGLFYGFFFVTENQYFRQTPGIDVFDPGAVLVFFLILNPAIDYVSLFCTRFIIQKVAENKLPVIGAIIVDLFASYFSYLIIFGLACLLMLAVAPIYILSLFDGLALLEISEIPVAFQNLIGILVAVAVISSYVSSMWLWAAALATFVIRVLSRSARVIATFQYVLPIKDKPVRSMGIVAFLLCLIAMITVSTVTWVSGFA